MRPRYHPSEEFRPRLVVATTVAMSADKLLAGQPLFLSQTFDVSIVTSDGPEVGTIEDREGVPVHVVPMERRPAPLRDLVSLWRLAALFHRIRPDIVHAYTPKAGLLAMLAAKLTGVPLRVKTVTGLPLMTETGLRRRLLVDLERLSYWAATDVVAESQGIRQYIADCVWSGPVGMIGNGSVNGIDLEYYGGAVDSERLEARRSLGVPIDAFVASFVGRLVRDKGVAELVEAFSVFIKCHPEAVLVLVGPHESSDGLSVVTTSQIREIPNILEAGWVDDVRPYLAAADVLVHPSYREGLPNVLLQAASYTLPIIASSIPGNTDIVRDGETGMLVPPMDSGAIAGALTLVADDHDFAQALGSRAHDFVARNYDQIRLWDELRAWYLARCDD